MSFPLLRPYTVYRGQQQEQWSSQKDTELSEIVGTTGQDAESTISTDESGTSLRVRRDLGQLGRGGTSGGTGGKRVLLRTVNLFLPNRDDRDFIKYPVRTG